MALQVEVGSRERMLELVGDESGLAITLAVIHGAIGWFKGYTTDDKDVRKTDTSRIPGRRRCGGCRW